MKNSVHDSRRIIQTNSDVFQFNSLAMFQTMINEILQNLINTGEIVSFINNVIIEMKKEGHDEVVEEVVKNLVENNLYVKPEKCK